MVYGMRVRPSSGLTTDIKVLDGDFNKVKALPDGDRFRVDPENLCTRFKFLSRDCSPPDDFDRQPFMNVSARAKEAIENLEPGVHQFVPVEYLDKRGRHLEHRFWFITGQIIDSIDSIDRAHTNPIFYLNSWRSAKDIARRYPELLPEGADPTAEPKLVFNLDQIGSAHMWRDRFAGGGVKKLPLSCRSRCMTICKTKS
ncbi:hypothetical protein E3U23_05780 [Erythrobacter litoralis]|nr:hypothetical protein [Erythrobacter litoralis]